MTSPIKSIASTLLIVLMTVTTVHSSTKDLHPDIRFEDNVVDVVTNHSTLNTFSKLLAESDLDDFLRDQEGPFTLVSPSDKALEQLGERLDEIRQDKDQLQSFLVNHMFRGEMDSEEVEKALDIELKETDINASNGVVHTVDEVITDSENKTQ